MRTRVRSTGLALVAFMLSLAVQEPTFAQSAANAHPVLTVHGVTFDSLHNRPLVDALVSLIGTNHATRSDTLGRFQFRDVPAGTYTLAMQHELFDSLGLSGSTRRVAVTDERQEFVLAMPSFATLWRAACGGAAPKDSGFVYGSVHDATGKKTVKNAVVEVTWTQVGVNNSLKISQRGWHSRAQSDSTGTYVVCGVPTDVMLQAQARAGTDASGLIDLIPDGHEVRRLNLGVGPTVSDSINEGTIHGAITTPDGTPLADVRVVADETIVARTNALGRFTMHNVLAGTRQLEIHSVGMLPVVETIDVTPGDTALANVSLHPVTALDAVKISASEHSMRYVADFEARRKEGVGYSFDSTTIAGAATMGQAFVGVPNVRVVASAAHPDEFTLLVLASVTAASPYTPVTTSTLGCQARIYIDGIEQLNYDDLRAMRPSDVAAVEIFASLSTTPAQFVNDHLHFGDRGVLLAKQACGTVVVWTKWAFS